MNTNSPAVGSKEWMQLGWQSASPKSPSGYTREQLETYITHMEARLKESASAWMKSEVRKGIELAKAELAKLNSK